MFFSLSPQNTSLETHVNLTQVPKDLIHSFSSRNILFIAGSVGILFGMCVVVLCLNFIFRSRNRFQRSAATPLIAPVIGH